MMETSSSTTATSINNNDEQKRRGGGGGVVQMEIDSPAEAIAGSPRITVSDVSDSASSSTPTPNLAPATASAPSRSREVSPRERKKSTGTTPRQRKRSQPVRGDLLPDPDKLLSYRHNEKRDEEELEDPSVPGGQPKPPPEPRAPGTAAERKRSNVTFCPVVETIEK